jgi:hypothetical protein
MASIVPASVTRSCDMKGSKRSLIRASSSRVIPQNASS